MNTNSICLYIRFALGACVIIIVATTINDIIMGYGSLRFFCRYIAEVLKKGRKKFSQYL